MKKTSSTRYTANQSKSVSHSVKSFMLVAALIATGWVGNAHALGLGHLRVQSALGQPLRAEVELTNAQAASLKAGMAAPAVYTKRGLQYSSVVKHIRSSIRRDASGRNILVLTSNTPINEPFVDIVVQASDRTGLVTRDFSILLDPPSYVKAPAPVVQPVAPAAPATTGQTITQRKVLTLPALTGEQSVAEPTKKRTVRKKRRRVVSTRARSGKVRVRRGFTASRIAATNRPRGVSLDQMLVALVQANPHAFIKGNVNLMHSGVVLRMPSKQEAQAISAQEARQIVTAHSNDFNNYRGRLASIPVAQLAPSTQQSAGKVQTQVEDRKVAAAPTPDKLTISKPKTQAKQEEISKKTEKRVAEALQKKENTSRAEELSRNLEDLEDISKQASAEAAKPVKTETPDKPTAAPEVEAKVPAVAEPDTAQQAKDTPAQPDADTAVADAETTPTADEAPAADATAQDAEQAADDIVVADAKQPAEEEKPKPEPKKEEKKPTPPPAPAPVEEPSFIDGLMENPLALGGGAIAMLGLAYIMVRRRKRDSESGDVGDSFLESDFTPDSFFHASGGRDIDTSDSSSSGGEMTDLNQSSMLYSPSQLDAEADVDPVSEADVYLAYGRDIQAEEILKDALLKQPDRIPVHAKLLEIYARRRDTKAFAQTAAELKRLTNGEGADWDAACVKGAEIDPGNPLYGDVSAVADVAADVDNTAAAVAEEPTPSAALEPEVEIEPSLQPAPVAEPETPKLTPATMPVEEEEKDSEPLDLSLSMPDTMDSTPDKVEPTNEVDFDMSGLSLDVEDGEQADSASADDAMATKLALAREFLDIGDRDGARAMAQEVVQNASGDLKEQAQSLLNDLS